ncbi:MAG: protein kinase domain-containing protein, partial [Polyangiaceae bacterium]
MGDDPLELAGDVIDGMYRVDSFVGFGDLSVVYRGFHIGVEADIAIKLLDLPTTLDAALVAPLVRSFRDGSRIHYRLARAHLHIAHSISSGQTLAPRTGAMMPYLVREWLDGFSLAHDFSDRSARKLGGRSLADTVELFRGAIDGLAYAHRQGVAHLALNPTNFFLARVGAGEVKLKILDFGVAHAINAHAGPGLRVLLPAYAAPEQLDAAVGESGPTTDVYAMALAIAEALAGKPMFGEAPPPL